MMGNTEPSKLMLSPRWFSLILLAAIIPISACFYEGIKAGSGIGALIGVVVGLAIGVCNYYLIRLLGKSWLRWAIFYKEQQHSMVWPERLSGFLEFVIFLWVFASGLLGLLGMRLLIQIHQ